jgi:choline dehydrogenase-like flavoprotein
MTEAFDFIVIGGGTAGCVFAARLSENPHHSVLLLEAGPRSSSLWTKIPAGYFKTVFDPKIGWGYATEPEPNLAGRAIPWPRGKLLGGTGAINEMAMFADNQTILTNGRDKPIPAGGTMMCCPIAAKASAIQC